MTNDQREIHRKKRVLEYAERIGNINKACRYFGVARSTFYLWRDPSIASKSGCAKSSRRSVGSSWSRTSRTETAWAELPQRVFEVDALRCPACGHRMRVPAATPASLATRSALIQMTS